MKTSRRSILAVWIWVYAVTLAFGFYFGLKGLIVVVLFFVLFIPPTVMNCIWSSRVMRRTRVEHPDKWKDVNRAFQISYYLFDKQDFGDPVLAHYKHELDWWMRAGKVCVVIFIPTLFIIENLGKK